MTFKKKTPAETPKVDTPAPEQTVGTVDPQPHTDVIVGTGEQVATPVVQKVLRPCSIPADVAGDVFHTLVNNRAQDLVGIRTNQVGGVTLDFKDKISGKVRSISLNRPGFVDVLVFGLEAISQNK